MTAHEDDSSHRLLEVPPLPSILDPLHEEAEFAAIVTRLRNSDGPPQPATVRDLKNLTVKQFLDQVDFERTHLFGWPLGLYIPADAAAGWPYRYGEPNRYAQSWTSGIGWSQADHRDGSLIATASSPTVGGAIDGKAEAGLGLRYRATETLARIRVQPDLRFTGRFLWKVAPPPTVWTSVRAVATVQVGGFQWDPAANRWGAISTSPWRRFEVFDRQAVGSGESALELTPFTRTSSTVSGEVLVEGGRTYLLSVVAQVVLRITTTDSAGRPVQVRDGRFDTIASLAGLVPEVWLEKTVYVA